MNTKYFAILLALPLLLAGSIPEHLKRAENKSGNHSIKNIDFIYVINLDPRPERWELCNKQLNPYGIYPYRFSAVNGWELSLDTINDVGLKYVRGMRPDMMGTSYLKDGNFEPYHSPISTKVQTYFCHCLARGTLGILLSHLSVLRDAFLSGYETIWIMEDDILVVDDPRKISDLISKLDRTVGKKNWDVLFTDRNIRGSDGNDIVCSGILSERPNFNPKNRDQYSVRQQVGKDFMRIGSRVGATSMIVRRSGMKKIYNFIVSHSFFLPYDLDYFLPPGIKLYTVTNNIVTNIINGTSDNGGPNYLNP